MKSSDKVTVLVAIIGGTCTLFAALIGLFNPITTKIAERILSPATATLTPTPTVTYTQTPLPTATAAATRLPTFAPPQNDALQFILANNAPDARTFYLDGAFVTEINSGQVLIFAAPRGTHQLEDCAVNQNPIANPDACDSQRYALNDDPFDWTVGEGATAQEITLILMNVSSTPTDIYLDQTLAHTVEPKQYYLMTTTSGTHALQNCAQGATPTDGNGNCIEPQSVSFGNAVEIWKVGD